MLTTLSVRGVGEGWVGKNCLQNKTLNSYYQICFLQWHHVVIQKLFYMYNKQVKVVIFCGVGFKRKESYKYAT